MSKKKLLAGAVITALAFGMPAFSQSVALSDLQELKEAKLVVKEAGKEFDKNHWAYKSLKNITKKYGVLLGDADAKFSGDQALTRNEAAVMLVNLLGKIEEEKIQLTGPETTKLQIMTNEFSQELSTLTGRVEQVESEVTTLKGAVEELAATDEKRWKVAYGEDFKIKGALQARFNGNIDNGSGASNFSLPTAEIGFVGKMHKHIKFVANFKPNRYYDGSTRTMMGDVYASTKIIPNHEIYIGQTRVPIGQEGTTSSLKTDFADYSQIARNFGGRRDIGLKIAGKYDKVQYFAGAYNGNAKYTGSDENSDMDIATWVNFSPIENKEKYGDFTFGGGYAFGKSAVSSSTPNVAFDTLGWHAAYKFKKLGIKYEGAAYDGYKAVNVKASGWNLTGLYDLTDKVQLLTRYDFFDPDINGNQNDINELSAGINYFMDNHNLKFQLNYVYVNRNSSSDSQKLLAQTQYAF